MSSAMEDEPPEVQREYKLVRLIAELDEFCAMAKDNPHQFDQHMVQVGRVVSRAELFAGFILGRTYPTHRLVGRAS